MQRPGICRKKPLMEPYRHTVKYYETDRMGFTHHSNYIRWMEEARIDFLDQLGYRRSTTFPDTVSISVAVEEFRGVRLRLKYVMTNEESAVVCEAASEHCFIGKDGKLLNLKKEYPAFYELLVELARPA